MIEKLQEIFLSLVVIILLVLLWNPFHLWMFDHGETMVVVGMILAFAVFASFIWREKARDEREESNFAFAGRVAFLTGTSILALGILIQDLRHNLDLWLVGTLCAMLFAKIIAQLYNHYKR